MIKAGVDQDAITELFAQANARQGEMLRKAVGEATLKALQGRELTLENMRRVLKAMTLASSAGVALNPGSAAELESMLGKSVAGMDAALQKAVQANRTALQQFMDLGVGLQCEQMKSALANLEKMEDLFFNTVVKAVHGANGPLQAPWDHVIKNMERGGTRSGAQASEAVAQLVEQSQSAIRRGRTANVRAAQVMMDGYATLVSGVLIGMTEGYSQAGAGAAGQVTARRK